MSDDGLRFERRDTPAPPEGPGRRDWRLPALIGVAVAAVLGVALALWARPNIEAGKRLGDTTAAEVNAAVPIEIAPGAPSTPGGTSRPGDKLEVLPPDMASAANARAPVVPDQPAPSAEGSGAPTATIVPGAPQAPLQPAPQTYAAAGRCAGAASLADEMVCQDPRLAAADREMSRALRRAMDAGAPPDELRAEQRDFAAIREDAARHSARALASAYAQRIDELNALAQQAGEDEGPRD
jgi:hypothetical protein